PRARSWTVTSCGITSSAGGRSSRDGRSTRHATGRLVHARAAHRQARRLQGRRRARRLLASAGPAPERGGPAPRPVAGPEGADGRGGNRDRSGTLRGGRRGAAGVGEG